MTLSWDATGSLWSPSYVVAHVILAYIVWENAPRHRTKPTSDRPVRLHLIGCCQDTATHLKFGVSVRPNNRDHLPGLLVEVTIIVSSHRYWLDKEAEVVRSVVSKAGTSRAGTSNYTPQYLFVIITCPCPWYMLLTQHSLSSPSAAYMRQRIGSALVRIMARRLFDAKLLSTPMLAQCQLGP